MVVVAEIFEIRHALAFHAIENDYPRSRIAGRNGLYRSQQSGNVIALNGHDIKTKGAEFIFEIKSANDLIQPAVKL